LAIAITNPEKQLSVRDFRAMHALRVLSDPIQQVPRAWSRVGEHRVVRQCEVFHELDRRVTPQEGD
jgi:hypothetical protein